MNTENNLSEEQLLEQLAKETNKYALGAILSKIAKLTLPPAADITPIIECTKSERWLVRHSAIQALGASNSDAARRALREWLSLEDEKEYKYELIYANVAMTRIGQVDDIPYIEKHIKSRFRDVRGSAEWAMDAVRSRNGKK